MNEELIKREALIRRIDAYIDCDDVRERESETQLLEDCRAALTRKYVPMTDDERTEMMARWYETPGNRCPISEHIEAEVIRRAGLEVSNEAD